MLFGCVSLMQMTKYSAILGNRNKRYTDGIIISIQIRHRITTWLWVCLDEVEACKNPATVDWWLLVGVIVVILAMRLARKRLETT
jgi:hypothetical protein